jgi:low affinity Fe/Cu permease
MKEKFARFAQWTSHVSGQPLTFAAMAGMLVVWGLSGPLFHFSDTWQLVINTTTSLITFLMVFIIQNTQNRDTAMMQIKLDELIRATAKAQNVLLDMGELDDDDLEKIRKQYRELAHHARSGDNRKPGPDAG